MESSYDSFLCYSNTCSLWVKVIFLTKNLNSATLSSSKTEMNRHNIETTRQKGYNPTHRIQCKHRYKMASWMESMFTYHWSVDSESTPLVCLRFKISDITLLRTYFTCFQRLWSAQEIMLSIPNVRLPLRSDWLQLVSKLQTGRSWNFGTSPFIETSHRVTMLYLKEVRVDLWFAGRI